MNHRIRRRAVLLGAVAALVASSFGGVAAADTKPVTIAVSVPSLSFPWYVHMKNEFQAEAQAIGGVNLVVLDGENQAPKQTSDVESALTQKVDAIVIAPIDVSALAPALSEAIQANIPVVTFDRSASNVQGIILHVGADNVQGGEAQGNQILKDFPNGAKIFYLQGQLGSGPGIDRNKGIHNVLDKAGDKYKLVFEQTANFARAEALSVTETGLTANDAPDVIATANDDMALGALEALKARGSTNVKVIGFDALPEALSLIRKGDMYATVEQQPGEQARTALRAAVDFVRSGKKPDKPVQLLTPFIITKDNVDKGERISEAK